MRKTESNRDKTLIMFLVGWKQRQDAVGFLELLTEDNNDAISQAAILSLASITNDYNFRKHDFERAFMSDYVMAAVNKRRQTGLPLAEAANLMAQRLAEEKGR